MRLHAQTFLECQSAKRVCKVCAAQVQLNFRAAAGATSGGPLGVKLLTPERTLHHITLTSSMSVDKRGVKVFLAQGQPKEFVLRIISKSINYRRETEKIKLFKYIENRKRYLNKTHRRLRLQIF